MAHLLPRKLDQLSANAWTRNLVNAFEDRVRNVLSKVTEEDIVLMSTQSLEIEDSMEEKQHDVIITDCPSISRAVAEILEMLVKLNDCWCMTPGGHSLLRKTLVIWLDYNTEINPRCDRDFPQHLASMLLKLNFLNKVFIDRDYSDKDRLCVVPFAWKNFLRQLIYKMSPLPVNQFIVYGGMYPTIIESIIYSSPYLTSVSISHINITDDLVLALSYSCPCLQQLYLMHCFPWQVISMPVFCSSFFSGATEKDLIDSMESGNEDGIQITFYHLSEIELCYGQIEMAVNFHKYLLHFYKNLSITLSEWRSGLFDEGYGSYCKNIVMPLISKGRSLYIEQLLIDGSTLYESDPQHMRFLAWSCPLIKELKINCNLKDCGAIGRSMKVVGRRLELLAKESRSISGLHINVCENDKATREILTPLINIRGSQIRSLCVEAMEVTDRITLQTLYLILNNCINITSLKLRVWHRSMVDPTAVKPNVIYSSKYFPKLEELWIHEDGMGDGEEIGLIERWKCFLLLLINSSPNLFTLSITLCQELSCILTSMTTNVQCLHLRIKDGYEWQPAVKDIYKLIDRQKELRHLFLEDVSGKNYWKIRYHYLNSSLDVHWGNLLEWPRS